jgi:hypothetical protein
MTFWTSPKRIETPGWPPHVANSSPTNGCRTLHEEVREEFYLRFITGFPERLSGAAHERTILRAIHAASRSGITDWFAGAASREQLHLMLTTLVFAMLNEAVPDVAALDRSESS